jgi:hypothetical protein
MGFDVEFGRYAGVQGQVGFDGLWRSGDLTIVVEVKTTDTYSIETATLLGYINSLISEQRIEDQRHALGLYVVGRSESENQHLRNAIMGERRTQELRVASVDAILSLAELVEQNHMDREEAVRLLSPPSPLVDDIVDLLARVAAEPESEPTNGDTTDEDETTPHERIYVMTPVADSGEHTSEQIIRTLLGNNTYFFGERTPRRREIKPGDRMCFYQVQVGVVAEAEVASRAERQHVGEVDGLPQGENFPWMFSLRNPRFFFEQPVVIDAGLRTRLEAFREHDPSRAWAWFVQATRTVTEHDFNLLTGRDVQQGDSR